DELMSWYEKTALPVADGALDTYIDAKGGSWPTYNDTVMASQTTCMSPLCHASVSTWCEASGKTTTSNEKKCRCARVTADTAAKAAEIINAVKAGGVAGGWTRANTDNDGCISCHQPAADPSRYDEQGKMDCIECHVPGETDATPAKSNRAPRCSK
ncbi:MAG TPA: hypothetical protein VNU93_01505, partial [Verrucomicrobiae bacterium]|nr:hypothetical protein [Verrucomicrobiae bacterium]